MWSLHHRSISDRELRLDRAIRLSVYGTARLEPLGGTHPAFLSQIKQSIAVSASMPRAGG